MLIGVSGIGPKAALAVLSTLTADNLRFAVLSEDVQAIAKTPGIGKKTAQKLILELKDKFDLQEAFEQKLAGNQAAAAVRQAGEPDAFQDAVQALTALGYLNGSTAGSKESRNHRRHGQRGCAESGIEAYVLADGPKLWKKETL